MIDSVFFFCVGVCLEVSTIRRGPDILQKKKKSGGKERVWTQARILVTVKGKKKRACVEVRATTDVTTSCGVQDDVFKEGGTLGEGVALPTP